MSAERRAIVFWLAVGAAGFLAAPWYALDASLFSTGWLSAYTDKEAAPALLQIDVHPIAGCPFTPRCPLARPGATGGCSARATSFTAG